MLYWAAVFFVIAIIAGALGFTNIMGDAAWVAKLLFVVFIIVFLISLVFNGISGRKRVNLP